jgi:hypothetical protein
VIALIIGKELRNKIVADLFLGADGASFIGSFFLDTFWHRLHFKNLLVF